MPEVRLRSIGRAVPERAFTQAELHARNPWPARPLVDRLFLDSPIRTRGFFVPPEFFLGGAQPTLEDTNRAWREGALLLGSRALDAALDAASLPPDAVDVFGVTTVTGSATPGLDVLLAYRHGMRADLARVHFNNLGCHAAIPLLRTVSDHVARRPGTTGVALAAEICSACFAADPTPENLVALSLFADGAAAAVLSTVGAGPVLVDFASGNDFAHQGLLGFDLRTEGFRIVLHPDVPERVGASVGGVVAALLGRHGLGVADIARWALHPGGSRILDAVQVALGLSDDHLRPSRRVLRDHGNMSSPSVLFALAEALAQPPPPGSHGVCLAFGPGLGIEALLLRF